MAKVNNPNDRELWLELLQIKRSRKGSFDEQQIDEIIDRYIEEGLEFKDDAYTGLSNALSILRKKRKRTQVTKKVLFIFLIMLAVGGLAWAGQKLYGGWKDKRVSQEHTQTAEFMAIYNTQEAKETRSFQETSNALAELYPTQTNTPLPTPTETPTPTPTPLQYPSTIAMGACNANECRWESAAPINAGFYALFVLKDAQETKVISESPGEISIDFANSLTADLGQCIGLDKGERCFIGLVYLVEQLSSVSGNSENLVNLEFIQILQSGETLGDVTDFLIPNIENVYSPNCQNGDCIVFGSYRPSRQIVPGSELRPLPSQTSEGINVYYISPNQSPDQSLTPLGVNPDGWLFNETWVDGGYFVVTYPAGSEIDGQMVLVLVNLNTPSTPEVQQ